MLVLAELLILRSSSSTFDSSVRMWLRWFWRRRWLRPVVRLCHSATHPVRVAVGARLRFSGDFAQAGELLVKDTHRIYACNDAARVHVDESLEYTLLGAVSVPVDVGIGITIVFGFLIAASNEGQER